MGLKQKGGTRQQLRIDYKLCQGREAGMGKVEEIAEDFMGK